MSNNTQSIHSASSNSAVASQSSTSPLLSLPPTPTIALGARAAELKEKLIRNREKKARIKETEPAVSVSTPEETHPPLPQQPQQKTFVANAHDIEALISSLSPTNQSSHSDIPSLDLSIFRTKPSSNSQLFVNPFRVSAPTLKPEVKKEPENQQVGQSDKTSAKRSPAQGPDSSFEEGEILAMDNEETQPEIPAKQTTKTFSCASPEVASTAMSAPSKPAINGKKKKDEQKTALSALTIEPISSVDAMQRLLNQVPDLKDWLEFTEYYDADSRTRKLDRYRRARKLAVDKKRIEEEERKLLEEEEREKEMQRLASGRPTTVTSHDIAASLLTSSSPSATKSQKRDYNDDGDDQRREKSSRLDDRDTDRRSDHGYSRGYDSYTGGGEYQRSSHRGGRSDFGGRRGGQHSPYAPPYRRYP
ncbi:hypothetical protein QBC43DRAFT_313580 [Cladorrhinum sp. PSN259]|nr:hypothetical protein QBC43DRAFT_313580 [Cladorrhinum sp. PSN259]